MRRSILVAICISVASLAGAAQAAEIADLITGEIKTEPGNKDIDITLKLHNPYDHVLCVPSRDFGGGQTYYELFLIYGPDGLARYTGPKAQWARSVRSYFRIVPAGESIEASYPLSELYDMAAPGDYHVEFYLPAIPCRVFDKGWIRMPYGYLLRELTRQKGIASVQKLDGEEVWNREGIIARLKPLSVTVDPQDRRDRGKRHASDCRPMSATACRPWSCRKGKMTGFEAQIPGHGQGGRHQLRPCGSAHRGALCGRLLCHRPEL